MSYFPIHKFKSWYKYERPCIRPQIAVRNIKEKYCQETKDNSIKNHIRKASHDFLDAELTESGDGGLVELPRVLQDNFLVTDEAVLSVGETVAVGQHEALLAVQPQVFVVADRVQNAFQLVQVTQLRAQRWVMLAN